jgi:hypothetical protein
VCVCVCRSLKLTLKSADVSLIDVEETTRNNSYYYYSVSSCCTCGVACCPWSA